VIIRALANAPLPVRQGVGVAVGMIFAPQSGAETRGLIKSKANESGDYLLAVRDGAIGTDHIRAELGEVLKGDRPGRTSADEITCFKSLGIGVEDLFAAEYLYRTAQEQNAGSWVSF